MGHIERLAERILFLKGEVETVPAGPVAKITDAQKILAKAAEMEEAGVARVLEFPNAWLTDQVLPPRCAIQRLRLKKRPAWF